MVYANDQNRLLMIRALSLLNTHSGFLRPCRIFIATDERNRTALNSIREHGVLLFDDLVTVNDRREFGWPIMLSDVVALVEQAALGIGAGFFYGHALSSVPGGVLNLRAVSGMDPRTVVID